MKTLLIYSGGMDSTVLMYFLKAMGHDLLTVGFNYGQKHSRELEHAKRLAFKNGIPFDIVDLSNLKQLLGGSSQTDDTLAVPDGHYTDESMKITVVPNRNMIMLSIAAGFAMSQKCNSVAYGAHTGDHAIYPDCRPEFADALDKVIRIADWNKLFLERPFINFSKRQIALIGKLLEVPFEQTWSCYKGSDLHCGKCGTCVERQESLNGFDPTVYEFKLEQQQEIPF